MRITIVGAGGVGGYFGAKLAKSGCEVGFVARGAHFAAMRQEGLRVESQLGEIYLPEVRASEDAAAFGAPDYCFGGRTGDLLKMLTQQDAKPTKEKHSVP